MIVLFTTLLLKSKITKKIPNEKKWPILRGRDIKKYSYTWANLWLIATHNGVKDRGKVKIPRIDINDYPAVKDHLDKYWDRIQRRDDQGDTPYNLRNCAYWGDFFKPAKIVYPNMTSQMPFYFDENNFITNQKCFIITGNKIAFLTAFFNSTLFRFCFTDNFPKLGEKGRELSKIFFDKIPVLQIDDKTEEKFKNVVIDIQKEYTEIKYKAIDSTIYKMYHLTDKEIEYIEDRAN